MVRPKPIQDLERRCGPKVPSFHGHCADVPSCGVGKAPDRYTRRSRESRAYYLPRASSASTMTALGRNASRAASAR